MAEDIRLSVGADTTQMESQIANAARKATVVIRPTVDSKGLEKISAPLGRITGQADEFSKSMEAANARVLAFGASVGVLNAVAKSFQNIVTASTQVEASLKEIQVATGETSGNLERLGKGIFEVARSTGLSFKQASEATLEFARQGGTLEDSLMKAKAALVLTRTTGLDAAEAVKGLTAAVLSFNQVGLDYETVVNKLAAVDTKFAVSSRDLIEGISRSASVAQEAGVSFDELTALITTLQEKTARGGAVIGNALKTIFQRVQTTENLDYIRNLGIAVNDVSGDILPATTIIKKLADEFQNLDSATRKGLLIKIGGGFQIDKLAALLNDISNANGTFNRSLAQSTNAGNQGFQKLDELNKTVQASFDRLSTSGTQFAATIGKIAFSDDFRSILNKTSSFLESLNESISGGEEGGATIGKSIVKGIGSIITGPGALLIAGLGIKLFGDLAKFGVDSLKNQLGVTNVKKEQQDIEKSILGLLLQNTAVQTKIVSLEGNKAAQAEYLLGLYSKQAATLERMSKLSKEVGPSVYEGGIRLTTEGTKNVKAKTAAGGYMSKDAARKMEMQEAPAGASIKEISNFNFGPTEGRGTMIVNSMESVYKTPMGDFVVPSYSKTRTGKPTLFSASGYVPNFADVQKSLDIDANAYSFAGLTIGGAGLKTVRGKQLNPQLLSEVKDPALVEALSKYSKLNFKNVSVGNIYRRRDQNLDSLEASEEDIKNHFLKKANDALSPQIGTFIKDELSSLGIKPTATMQLMMKNGRKFNFVNDSMAGTFFETMLKMANMSAEDDNFGQFFNDSNSRFDIYGLKSDIAEQYGLPKKFWEYVEIKSSEKALNDELGTKFIQQLSQSGGESLKAKLLNQAKTGARGYVPNFAQGAFSYEKTAKELNLKSNADRVDSSKKIMDSFTGNISPVYQKKTIEKYTSESQDIVSKIVKRLGKTTGKKIDNDALSALLTKFGNSGVDTSKIKTLRTAIENLDPKNRSKGYKNVLNIVKGILGEIDASKLSGESLTKGNAFLDLVSGDEVKTTQSQTGSEVFLKVVNDYLSGKNLKNNKADKIRLGSRKVYIPKGTPFTAARGYVPNFAIRELKNAPVMTIGDRVKGATVEQLKSRLGGNESYTTDLAGTKINQSLDIEKIKNDVAASILGPNYHLLGNDGSLDKAYYAKLMSAFTSYKTGKTNKTAFGQMPEVKSDENRAVTGEVSGFARELKYEKLGQIFDIIAKNRNMQDVWTQIFQTKAGAGARSINSPDEQSKISKLVTQFRPVVIDELTKRLKTKVSAIMTTIGRDDAEFLALGKSVDIDQYGNLLLPDKLKVDQLQQERRFVMPLQTPENLKRVGKSKLDRIVLNDPKKRPSEGEDSTFYKTRFNASDVLSIISQSEYSYPSYATKKEDKYGNIRTGFVTGWKGEYGIENKLNKLAEKNPFLARKIKSNFKYDKVKAKMVVANAAEFENLRTILETLRDFGVSDWDNINFEKSLQTYAPTKTAAKGYIPNFSREAVLDAIGREKKQSGLPLSAIKVVQDARVRGPQNPNGYAVINDRDEPNGKVPNFADPSGKFPQEVFDALTSSVRNLLESTNPLNDGFKNIASTLEPFGVKLADVTRIAEEMTSPLSEVAKVSREAADSTKKNTDQGNKDSQDKKGANEKETKTIQDSLYTLLKWQTVIAGVSGALSTFGGDVAKSSEAVGSLFSAFIGAREAKGIGAELLGKNKEGKQATVRDAFKGNIEGKGALAGIGAIAATGGAYIAAGVAAVQALDSAIQVMAGTSKKSENIMLGLTKAQERYSASLTETQKKIQEQIGERFNVSGAGIGGFLNQIGVTGLLRGQQTKSIKEVMGATGLDENANRGIAMDISSLFLPQAQQQLGDKATPKQISDEVTKKTLELISKAENMSKEITGYKDTQFFNTETEKYETRKVATYGDKIDPKRFQENLEKLRKEQEPSSEKAVANAKLLQESYLYSLKYLQNQLTVSGELLKIQNSIASSEENLLKFKKDNIRTSEAEKILIDFKLQKLEAERNLRSDIQQTILSSAREEVGAFFNRKGGKPTQEEASAVKELYEGLAKAAVEGGNVAEIFNQFIVKLNKAGEKNEEFIGSLSLLGKGLNDTVGVMTSRAEVAQQELQKATLMSAINQKISYEYNAQKQFLTDKLAIQQKGLDIAREEASLARGIRDSKFNVSLIGKSPRQQQIATLQRQASGITRQDELKDLENTRAQAALAARSKVIQSILEKDTTVNPADLENLSQQDLKSKFIEASTKRGSQLDTTIDQLSKGGDIFQTKVGTAGDIVKSKFSDAAEALAKTLGVKPVQQSSTFGAYPQGLRLPEKGDGNEPTELSKVLPAETQTDLDKARKAAENQTQRAETEYSRIYSETALPRNKESSINQDDLERRLKAVYELDSMTTFSGGMRKTMLEISDEIDSFGNTLGKEIPMNFRNGLVDAMKALTDPNATDSLKERLMNVAGAFLNKINEAFMMQTANKITRGIFGDGTPGSGMAGGLGFASGGVIEGGSGTKDDVPAMLMGGEYVIRKNVVNKYGKDFFDRLNAGKMKGFANGGLATFNGFEAADVKDTVVNPTNYIPYGETRMGGLSFDANGKVIGMDSYTGDEQGKQNALMQAQTSFYSNMAQSGGNEFYTPGTYGKGAIIGQENLLKFATQDTIGTQFDKFSNMGNMAGIDIAGGSANLSLFALRDQGNIRNAEYIDSKNKALDLYLGGIDAEKQKYAMDEENRKEYEQLLKDMEEAKEKARKQAKKQMQGILLQAGLSIAVSAIGSSMAKGWDATAQAAKAAGGEATFMQKLGGAFTGGTMTNGAGVSETRGGLFNMFDSSGYKDFSVIGNPTGGLQQWNSGLGQYTPMGPDKFSNMYQPYQNVGRLSYDAFGSPVIGGPLPTGPSSGFNFSRLNPMNWFSGGTSRATNLNMDSMGFGGVTQEQAFPSPIGQDSVVGMTAIQKQQYINSMRSGFLKPTLGAPNEYEVSWNPEMGSSVVDSNGRVIKYAAGGTVQGNGMGDNVPAMLNGGEFVMSKQAAQKIGYNNLQQMNSNPQDSGSDITSRIEAKLEELFDKVSGVGTINISVTSDGKGGKKDSEESSNQDQQNKELARKMKEVVLNVLRDEKRLGGLLR